jgi:hypothetical protein
MEAMIMFPSERTPVASLAGAFGAVWKLAARRPSLFQMRTVRTVPFISSGAVMVTVQIPRNAAA